MAGRFVLEAQAGTGGMGEVYRATDLQRGAPVAVKLLRAASGADAPRFLREARLLEGLEHPGIVRHVAHGSLPSGALYLAMEWLEGEDLSRRLGRGPLGVDEGVEVARCVAEALGAAHARGVVHRDLKPSNVFLVGEGSRDVRLLDFGVAWAGGTRMTQSGVVIGTPAYMAPEQARSEDVVDARADVFALGCLLFECLTGEPAFGGDHFMSILAKVLFADPPRLRDVRSDVPEPIAALCARMLSKRPDARPRDGREAAEALLAIQRGEHAPASAHGPAPSRPGALTATERRSVAVLLIGAIDAAAFADVATEIATVPSQLVEEASAWGARVEPLPGGAAVLTMAGQGAATDLAWQAARVALALRRQTPDRPMALALGWSAAAGRMRLLRDAIDRAARLISARGPAGPGDARPIAIDEGLVGLIDARFDVREHEERFFLVGERSSAGGGRTLLGKPTPCVGRDGELRMLEAAFEACVDEPSARAVLVIAPPGVGKSRLAQEFLRRVAERAPRASTWTGRGDPLRAGSPYGLLAGAIQGACGIVEGDALAARRDKVLARVARRVPEAERPRTAAFVGELIGAPFPDGESSLLRAARRDARIMAEQVQRAFLALVRAACAEGPVVLVLEDLHWGDPETMRLVDAALRHLADEPLFVLALARPEVTVLFPRLWAERSVHELRLKDLGKKACERLARLALGEGVPQETLDRIVALADGNGFYLEELIRAAAEGRGEALPETVVAMVQSRLDALGPEARLLLRAASVFGEACWASGVEALVGAPARDGLAILAGAELLVRRPASRFPGEEEFGFRHALLRQGAYAMLGDEDRALGHRLAGRWLEERGEADPLVLAEHLDKGGERARASRYWLRAAEIAHRSGDVEAALSRLDRGLAGEAPADVELGLRCELAVEDPWGALQRVQAALDAALRVDDARGAGAIRILLGTVLWTLGATARAEEVLGCVPGPDEEYGAWSSYRPFVRVHVALVRGDLDGARRLAEALIVSGRARSHSPHEGRGRWLLAEVLGRAGELDRADRELDAALGLLPGADRTDRPGVIAARAELRLRQGRAAEALAAIEETLAPVQAMGGACGLFQGARIRLAHVACLDAVGRRGAAEAALAAARDRLLRIAGTIPDPAYRKSFLEEVPENRTTLALARERLGDAPERA
ncbi:MULTISPECIES: serine/threonine-protein kinase [Sorangium]|uniref:serine/threonine-protein kinase n=1 Tax=Sorangium TaxID=39643 RepID=UPI001EEE37B2|nr:MULTISPECIES: serine/threonine-protein kinase [Sorangium]